MPLPVRKIYYERTKMSKTKTQHGEQQCCSRPPAVLPGGGLEPLPPPEAGLGAFWVGLGGGGSFQWRPKVHGLKLQKNMATLLSSCCSRALCSACGGAWQSGRSVRRAVFCGCGFIFCLFRAGFSGFENFGSRLRAQCIGRCFIQGLQGTRAQGLAVAELNGCHFRCPGLLCLS